MAWLTGKVQVFNSPPPRVVTVGEPFAYEKDGKWYCVKTDAEFKVTHYSPKDLREKVEDKEES